MTSNTGYIWSHEISNMRTRYPALSFRPSLGFSFYLVFVLLFCMIFQEKWGIRSRVLEHFTINKHLIWRHYDVLTFN